MYNNKVILMSVTNVLRKAVAEEGVHVSPMYTY